MADQIASRDPNRVPTLVGVDSVTFKETSTAAVNPTTHQLLVTGSVQLIDSTGTARGVLMEDGSLTERGYLQAIAEGDVAGHSEFEKYGRCTVSNTAMDIWEGNSVYVFPTSAGVLDIVSTDNTNDKAGGTGALKIKVNGLNGSYVDQTEEVTLNGTTIVPTVASFLRVNMMWVSSAGSTGAAAGTITAKVHGGSTVYGQISPGLTHTRQLIYTVPATKTLFVTSITISTGVGNTTASGKFNFITFTLRATRDPATFAVTTIYHPLSEVGLVNTAFYRPFEMPIKVPATADVRAQAVGDTALAVSATGTIRGWLE